MLNDKYMINAIKKRRAHREFLDDAISNEKIQELIKAAAFAPSANAKYTWEMVIVKEPATKDELSKVTPWATFAKDAAIIIAVIGHESENVEWVEDCSIVAEHIWLEATEQNLGCCWIQIRNQGQAEKDVKEILNIPSIHRVLCLLPIGIPAKTLAEHDESIIDKSKVKLEKYR
jgi:nitroreductase